MPTSFGLKPSFRAANSRAPRIGSISKKNKRAKQSLLNLPKIVSLFCGAGGLDWGFRQEGFEISLAIDLSEAAIKSHNRNFKNSHALVADLTALGPLGVVELVKSRIPAGSRIGVIGGPPCQGFSRANTNSQPDDPRNELPFLYLQIVQQLKHDYSVEFVVLENVLGIRDKKHAATFKAIIDGLDSLGLAVTEKELCAIDYGVPQNRRRIILSGLRKDRAYKTVAPRKSKGLTTVRQAIGKLAAPAFYSRNLSPSEIPVHPNHWTMRPKSPRFSNPDEIVSSGRSFKRLSWNEASPTIAFGNREIHVHPTGTRRLSIYEAMLLQGFPPSFVLEGNLSEQVEQVSNAVPPPLARSVAAAVKRAIASN